MRPLRKLTALVVVALLLPASLPAAATERDHVVSVTEIEQALQRQTTADAQRAAVLSLLRRPEVRELAARAGLEMKTAEASVRVLEGNELKRLAQRAADAERALAGGGSGTITISTVTLLLIIIIIILLAK